MAGEEQGGEKTEDATEKKRADARIEGQIAKSPEFMTAAFLLATTLTLTVAGPPLWHFLLNAMGESLMYAGDQTRFGNGAVATLQGFSWRTLAALSGVLAASMVIAVAVNLAQVGPLFTTKTLVPKFSRINPLEGAKKIFSVRSLVELAKQLGKMGIVALVVWMTMRRALPELETLAMLEPSALMSTVGMFTLALLRNAGMMFLVLALMDFGYQRWQTSEDLKMSKQEVKDEYKSAEGDGNIKSRRRSIARERLRRQMFTDVPSADVVIVNPTHIAIALKYDTDLAPAPFVIALGQRKIAEKIKAIAFASGVPVIENKPLARALIKAARVGSMIPVDFYLAVAEVLAFVLRQRQRYGNRWRGNAAA